MRAIRIPYPSPKSVTHRMERVVDFPERHLSYAIVDCIQADMEQCVLEVIKAVNDQSPGREPQVLEVRLP